MRLPMFGATLLAVPGAVFAQGRGASNITNSSASETITQTTDANYLRPVNILAPAAARLDFRLPW